MTLPQRSSTSIAPHSSVQSTAGDWYPLAQRGSAKDHQHDCGGNLVRVPWLVPHNTAVTLPITSHPGAVQLHAEAGGGLAPWPGGRAAS